MCHSYAIRGDLLARQGMDTENGTGLPEVSVEHHEEEEVEVEEEGERAEAECSPTTPQQPGHWDTEGVATSNKGGDDTPRCHGDEIQHDLAECDITRSPGHSAHLPPLPAIPSGTARLQPPPTALATPPPWQPALHPSPLG